MKYFRGKRNDDKEWVYGFYCPCCFDRFPCRSAIIPKKLMDNGSWEPKEVIPESVGQYTGLDDKNGTKIFEGDVVLAPYLDPIFHSEWKEGNPTENTVVKYGDGVFYIEYIESKRKITLFGLLDGENKIEVIGNIYDNPELLKAV